MWRLSPHLLQSLRQQFLFPQVLRQGNGALDFLARLREPTHLHQQVSANTVKQMIASQRRVSSRRSYGIECVKPSGRPLLHTHSDFSIQCHDGRWRGLHQSVVEKNDPFPVCLFGGASAHMTGSNRCLQCIGPGATAESLRVFECSHASLNLRAVPQRTILIRQQDRLTVTSPASRSARRIEFHQSQKCSALPSSPGLSVNPGGGTARLCSSRPTSPVSRRTASTNGSVSPLPTKV